MKNTLLNYFTIACFVVFLSLPAFYGIISPQQTNSQIENRRLTDLPIKPTSWEQLKEAPKAFDNYYADHFGLRWPLLYLYRHLKYFIHDSPLDTALFGSEKGWIFYANKPSGDIIGDFRNINQFSDTQMAVLIKHLKQKQQWLKQQGIQYLFVIAPSKHYIYPEKLPAYIQRIDYLNVVTQLQQELVKHPEINFLDLTPVIQQAKKQRLLYYRSDTHWNYFGANHAQYAMAQRINKLIPKQMIPYLYPNSAFTQKQMIFGDLAAYMGLGDFFMEQQLKPNFAPCTEYDKKNKTLFSTECKLSPLNALIFRDSFFTQLQPYISQYFHQSVFSWEKMTFNTAEKLIQQNKPDIVIEQWVDRYLPKTMHPEYIY